MLAEGVLLLVGFGLVVVGVAVLLLLLGAIGDEVSGVAALEAAPGVASSPLLPELVHPSEFLGEHRDLIIGDVIELFIGSCRDRRQSKLQRR